LVARLAFFFLLRLIYLHPSVPHVSVFPISVSLASGDNVVLGEKGFVERG
jgi:hypothetical protein